MANFTVTRIGADNGGVDKTALFLKVFSGEVLKTFEETNVMKPLHMVRTIASGKSAQFIYHGTTTAAYHTPGNELLGNSVNASERVISIDGLLVANVSVADIDELMAHYDVRAEYASLLGRALAKKYDQQLCQLAVLAARASATITGNSGGSTLTNAAFETDGEALADGLFDAAQALDEKDVPSEDRFLVLRPAQYYKLARATKVLNKDWDGAGSFSKGKVLEVAGIKVIESNNLPSTNVSADSPAPVNTYHGDFSNTMGVVFHKSAIGTVQLMDIGVETERSVRHQASIMVGKIACGHGILRPESSIELKKA
jgi:hypothetical protein